MNFVGKILVVVQVTLSLMFMAFAGAVYTAQQNWRTAALDAQKAQTQAAADLSTLQTEFDRHRENAAKSLAEMTSDRDTEAARAEGLDDRNQTLESEIARTRTERDAALAESEIASTEATSRIEESKLLRSNNAKLHDKVLRQTEAIRTLQDDVLSRDRSITLYEQRQKTLLADVANMRKVMIINDLDPEEEVRMAILEPPPLVKGFVRDSKRNSTRDTEFVHVSIGSDDGLERGHSLFVHRDDQYLASIRLVDVRPDSAVGVVTERARNGSIESGDNVSSKL